MSIKFRNDVVNEGEILERRSYDKTLVFSAELIKTKRSNYDRVMAGRQDK